MDTAVERLMIPTYVLLKSSYAKIWDNKDDVLLGSRVLFPSYTTSTYPDISDYHQKLATSDLSYGVVGGA